MTEFGGGFPAELCYIDGARKAPNLQHHLYSRTILELMKYSGISFAYFCTLLLHFKDLFCLFINFFHQKLVDVYILKKQTRHPFKKYEKLGCMQNVQVCGQLNFGKFAHVRAICMKTEMCEFACMLPKKLLQLTV